MSPDSPTDGPTARPRTARQTRDRIARAALALFASRGFHDTTTPQIAERAGVAEGTIYRHFPTKDDLLNEVFRAAVRALHEPVRTSDPDRPVRKRLEAIAERWIAVAASDPDLIHVALGDRFVRHLDERSRATLREFRASLERTVAAGKSVGAVRAGPADLWADLWLRIIAAGLERVAAGAWRSDDLRVDHVRGAAWDAIRAIPLPDDENPATIQRSATHDPASGAHP